MAAGWFRTLIHSIEQQTGPEPAEHRWFQSSALQAGLAVIIRTVPALQRPPFERVTGVGPDVRTSLKENHMRGLGPKLRIMGQRRGGGASLNQGGALM